MTRRQARRAGESGRMGNGMVWGSTCFAPRICVLLCGSGSGSDIYEHNRQLQRQTIQMAGYSNTGCRRLATQTLQERVHIRDQSRGSALTSVALYERVQLEVLGFLLGLRKDGVRAGNGDEEKGEVRKPKTRGVEINMREKGGRRGSRYNEGETKKGTEKKTGNREYAKQGPGGGGVVEGGREADTWKTTAENRPSATVARNTTITPTTSGMPSAMLMRLASSSRDMHTTSQKATLARMYTSSRMPAVSGMGWGGRIGGIRTGKGWALE